MLDPTAVLVAAIGALASIAAAVGTARAATRGAKATAAVSLQQVEAEAYKRARDSYESAMKTMQAEIERQARQINTLQLQVVRLTRQVRAAGLVPVTSSEEDE